MEEFFISLCNNTCYHMTSHLLNVWLITALCILNSETHTGWAAIKKALKNREMRIKNR